jgi:hypothetical protein
MFVLRRVALLAAATFLCWPAAAIAQGTSVDSLARRVELLELTTSELAARVRQLEALVGSEPSRDRALPAPAKWRDLQNWRRLRRGMKMDEVRALLGEPERVDNTGYFTTWRWQFPASVEFDSGGKLRGWSEP